MTRITPGSKYAMLDSKGAEKSYQNYKFYLNKYTDAIEKISLSEKAKELGFEAISYLEEAYNFISYSEDDLNTGFKINNSIVEAKNINSCKDNIDSTKRCIEYWISMIDEKKEQLSLKMEEYQQQKNYWYNQYYRSNRR